ncbi:hypothetical protein HY798_03305 [Candidatus Falkowbacteria bacterium]|nr:hypothetical protein [Candidatus Falkowbacteria bacterium]
MTIEKWRDTLGNIKDNFEVEDEGSEHLEEEGGVDVEYIVFKGPLGRMRLEFVTKPVLLDKKTIYSKRIGSETKVEYVYGDEKSSKLVAYKWDEESGEWAEMAAKNFSL